MNELYKKLSSKMQSDEFNKVIRNSAWLFADKLLKIISGLFVGTLVAKHFGPEQYGIYSYVISLVSLVSIVSTLGLEQIVIKELVLKKHKESEILGTAFTLRLIGAIALIFISLKLVDILNDGNHLIKILTLIISTGYIFQAFNVLDEWFQSKIKSKYVVISRDIALLIGMIVKIYIVRSDLQILWLGYVLTFELIFSVIIMVFLFLKHNKKIIKWKFKSKIAFRLLSQSWPLITSSIMVMIYMKIDQVMVLNLNSSSQSGQYAAAVQLSETWYFIPTIITSSVYPHLIKIIDDKVVYLKRNNQLFLILAIISYLVCIPASILAIPITNFLYGSSFPDSGIILAIHVWSLLFVSMGVGQSPWVISKELTKITMIWSILGAAANIILNIAILPKYGGVGAAISTLISYALSGFLLNYFNKKTRPIFWSQLRAILLIDLFASTTNMINRYRVTK